MFALQILLSLFLIIIVVWNFILIVQPFYRKKMGATIFPIGKRAGKGTKQVRSTSSWQYKMGQVFIYFYTPISIYAIIYLWISNGSMQNITFGVAMIGVSLASYTMFSNILEVREKGILLHGVNIPMTELKSWSWIGNEENRLRVYRKNPILKVFSRLTTTELPSELKEDLQEWLEKNK
ncbi:hypothetical protein GCM10008967_17030 [Bacillus carboniphilus]|uniref:DUF5673 domain-containing protein n=1 Tax=Bacillus carboniphilus TaxID=86663 RepID=A0ABP3FYT2_9BACI